MKRMNELHGTEFWRFWKAKMKYTNKQNLKFILSSYHIYSRTFQWMFCPNCDWFFAAISRKYNKRDIFDILMIITLEANMITREITPFFMYSLSSIRWYISFLHFQNFKTQFHVGPPFALCSGLQTRYIHAKDDTFRPIILYILSYYPYYYTDILFLHKMS